MNVFDFVKSINTTKVDLLADDVNGVNEKEYAPFIVNKALSYFPDTVIQANDMNMHHSLDKKLQYDFFINSVRPRNRYSKWVKSDISDVELLQRYYNCSYGVAKQYQRLFTADQIRIIRTKMEKGESDEFSKRSP